MKKKVLSLLLRKGHSPQKEKMQKENGIRQGCPAGFRLFRMNFSAYGSGDGSRADPYFDPYGFGP